MLLLLSQSMFSVCIFRKFNVICTCGFNWKLNKKKKHQTKSDQQSDDRVNSCVSSRFGMESDDDYDGQKYKIVEKKKH